MADIVIINPRFEPSYWGMDHALPFMGKSANLPVASLPLLAALTPARAHGDADGRERRADRLGAVRAGGYRGPDRHERAAVPHDGDPHRAEGARLLRRGGGALDHGPGGLFRRAGGRDLHRRGRADLAAVPPRVAAGAAPVLATSRPRRPT